MADKKNRSKQAVSESAGKTAPGAKNASKSAIDDSTEKARSFLLSSFNSKGYWPYKKDGMPSLEATAWCGFALKDDEAARSACRFFVETQNEDGGWSTAPEDGNSDWVSGPVLLAFRSISAANHNLHDDKKIQKSLETGIEYVIESRAEFYTAAARLVLILGGPKYLDYARGWRWDDVWGCFHFVEPTSYHLMALKIPDRLSLNYIDEVIKHANQFLLEHPCKTGGWTYGMATSLGSPLPPFRVTTAEALLALQDRKDAACIKPALQFLQSQAAEDSSAMSLAWSILALNAYDVKCEEELAFLKARQQADGGFSDNMMVNALALMALESEHGKNPLKLSQV